ncbi:DUF2460 domain-containing protein [Synechocystis sp. FACHB-383]|uniref:DUF2460 domain-containing protein n=1 Tax=Synechocystis sp. FACHB-383 TaxID=2692864 RepID=UPI0016892E21|nr:DUF2460 domain-containing protein [Synechocystis sp. FACHB-383]MBD2653679.1 DUF2460 domain-containing protein [Synechocystis sp. FACHB-383]
MALLDLGINYGASYSLNFSTDIISNREGIEQRRALYQQPLLKVAIGNRMVNKGELDYLLAFFEAAQGRLNEFEIRDWTDYQVTDGSLGPVIEGRQSVIKTYSLGGESIQRLLTAVVEETIVDDGGVISCEFNVPVRFDQDAFPLTFEAYSPDGERLFSIQELSCTEIRKAWPDAPLQLPPASIDADLGIGKDYGTTGGQAYSTSIMALPSGWDDRQANYSGSKSQWNIGAKLVNVAEMTRMITMFRLCRGQLVPFNFYDWQTESTKLVRFDSDSLGLQFEAHDENYYGENIGDRESLFALNGLPVKVTCPVQPTTGVCTPQTLTYSATAKDFSLASVENLDQGGGGSLNPMASMQLVNDGGNPGEYGIIRLDFGGNLGSGVTGYWLSPFSYVPQSEDEIITIDYSEDVKRFEGSWEHVGQSIFLVVWQCPFRYQHQIAGFAGNVGDAEWTNKSQSNISLSEMGVYPIPGVELRFGFARLNGHELSQSFIAYTQVGIDNWELTINVGCPEV